MATAAAQCCMSGMAAAAFSSVSLKASTPLLKSGASSSSFTSGAPLIVPNARVSLRRGVVSMAVAEAPAAEERFRLNNLGPQPGSRRKEMRKGRGYGAGQGGSCGFGMRGQKSRSGSGVRPGFEGGQIPLYRRLPKLRGIAGGMPSGQQKHVIVNLEDLKVNEGEEVTRESLIASGVIKASGKRRNLPLKVLGDGEVNVKFTIKAGAFSKTALEKLEKAGCTVEKLKGRKRWTKKSAAFFAEKAEAKK